KDAYNYRFSQWIPIWVAWKILGVGEYGFILPITAASVAAIPLAYLLGAELFTPRAGVLAAVLLAANPFDTLASTLFIPDVLLALYLGSAALCFFKGEATGRQGWFVLAAVWMCVGYYSKPFALFLLPFFALLTLSQPRLVLRHWVFYATLAVL